VHAADLETEVPVVLKDIIESVGAGSHVRVDDESLEYWRYSGRGRGWVEVFW
jgi:hypothetical protein